MRFKKLPKDFLNMVHSAYKEGYRLEVIAQRTEAPKDVIMTILRGHGIVFTRGRQPIPDAKRAEMKRMRDSGETYQKIAEYYGISRQRVHQIIRS